MKIFLAGAGGAIGRKLTPLLRAVGHTVIGSTRSADKAESVRALGAEPVVVDVFDAEALARAVGTAAPDAIIHQLTDLAFAPGTPQYDEGRCAQCPSSHRGNRAISSRRRGRKCEAHGRSKRCIRLRACERHARRKRSTESRCRGHRRPQRRSSGCAGASGARTCRKGSCCVSDISTDPGPGTTRPRGRHRSTSRLRHAQRCRRSPKESPASTISRKMAPRCRAKRPSRISVSTRRAELECGLERLAQKL